MVMRSICTGRIITSHAADKGFRNSSHGRIYFRARITAPSHQENAKQYNNTKMFFQLFSHCNYTNHPNNSGHHFRCSNAQLQSNYHKLSYKIRISTGNRGSHNNGSHVRILRGFHLYERGPQLLLIHKCFHS